MTISTVGLIWPDTWALQGKEPIDTCAQMTIAAQTETTAAMQ